MLALFMKIISITVNAIIGLVAAIISLFIFASILSLIFAFLFNTVIGRFLIILIIIFVIFRLLADLSLIGKELKDDLVNKIKKKERK